MSKIIAANWKMNKTRPEAKKTCEQLVQALSANPPKERDVFLFPPFPAIETVASVVKPAGCAVKVGAQNFYPEDSGAFTGEVSLNMLADCGAEWVLVGHSERRHILHESDAFIGEKVAFALKHGFGVMLCIGETLEERESGSLRDVLKRQLETALTEAFLNAHDDAELQKCCILAYEPVWAIGTGKVAGPGEVLEAHALVKDLAKHLARDVSFLPVLYGGSVKSGNARQLLELQNVDGLLVGGASLDAETFLNIITA